MTGKMLTTLICGFLVLVSASYAVQVDGYCYLEEQTSHEGTKVLFQASWPPAVTDSTYTDAMGYFQKDLTAGSYSVYYTHTGYLQGQLLYQYFAEPTTLPVMLLAYIPQGISISGALSGVLEDTTYLVQGDISVEAGNFLTIEAGANLLFGGNYTFTINGTLNATGTASENITFKHSLGLGASAWGGIHFTGTSSSCNLSYCTIYGSNSSGIYINNAAPTISNCIIRKCSDNLKGGGIYCDSNSSPIINGCTIDSCTANQGAGIYVYSTTPDITGCTIRNNTANEKGGGIYNADNSSAVITNCTIENNTAVLEGGGVYNGLYCTATLTGCAINDNTSNGKGGGISNGENSNPVIEDCSVSYNEISNCDDGMGAGIFNGLNSTATITNCTINNNSFAVTCLDGYGAGVFCYEYATPTIEKCTINDNTGAYHGGGIGFDVHSDANIIECQIHGNSGDWGAGIYCQNSSPTIRYSTLWNNTAEYNGGGLSSVCWEVDGPYIYRCSFKGNSADWGGALRILYGAPEIVNCTISDNAADSCGGGIYLWQSQTSIINTIVESCSGLGGVFFDSSANASVRYSDFYNNENNAFAGPTIPAGLGAITGTNYNNDPCDTYFNIFLDPLFVNPAGNFQLQAGSPCIDAGDPDPQYNDPDGSIADIGAFWYDPTAVEKDDPNPQIASENRLHQNYPNPFNPVTAISYKLQATSFVNLTVYDIAGKKVAELVNGWRDAGIHEVIWDASDAASGVYLYCLKAGNFSANGKMVLLK